MHVMAMVLAMREFKSHRHRQKIAVYRGFFFV